MFTFRRAALAGFFVVALHALVAQTATFTNPIAEGADPWVVRHEGKFYWCFSDGNRAIAVHRRDRLTSIGEKFIVWRAPETGPYSRQLWAPELHFLDGKWWVYVAASDGKNENHRTIVLGSAGADPLGPYELKGELYTGDDIATKKDNRWAIDGTVLEHGGKRYLIWSGWQDTRDEQWLYIATMSNPWTLSSNRVRLAANADHLWERVDEKLTGRGLAEAPQVLVRDGRVFVVYSCSGSWQTSYKLGLLTLAPGGDPMNPAAWTKSSEPVFRGDTPPPPAAGAQPRDHVYGVGHNCFIISADGREDWFVYHAKVDRRDGWRRALHLQPLRWRADGTPDFGRPIPSGEPIPVPAATPTAIVHTARAALDLRAGLGAWDFYGHHQLYRVQDDRLVMGSATGESVNVFRSGEKLLLRDSRFADCRITARLRLSAPGKSAGLVLRASAPAVGTAAFRGYYVGIAAAPGEVIIAKSDGKMLTTLATAPAEIALETEHTLVVFAEGSRLRVQLNGREILAAADPEQHVAAGQVGVRTSDGAVSFSSFEVVRWPPD